MSLNLPTSATPTAENNTADAAYPYATAQTLAKGLALPLNPKYSAVFDVPKNGLGNTAPERANNITKAGCIALAKQGTEAWNTWCKDFPVRGDRPDYENYADFSGHTFTETADFSGFEFGTRAYFEGAKFEGDAYFEGAKFEGDANFNGAKFEGDANFNGATFKGWINFKDATFTREAHFNGAMFKGWTNFNGATFKGWTNFKDATFTREAHFNGATFENSASFARTQFKSHTSFDQAKFENEAPRFQGASLFADTHFDGARFPKVRGDADAMRAYRTLKLAFSKEQATREEQRFFSLEMDEEALIAPSLKNWWVERKQRSKNNETSLLPPRFFYTLYRGVSGYGFSVARPLVWLVLLPYVLALGLGYWAMLPNQTHSADVGWLLLGQSTSHVFPFFTFSAPSAEFVALFKPVQPPTPLGYWLVSGFATVQKLLAFLGWFLVGLALRNQFKLK